MRDVILKTFTFILLFFAFLFFGLEIFQAMVNDVISLISMELSVDMIQAAYKLIIKVVMFFLSCYFVYLTYSMMDAAIGVWAYKDDVSKDFNKVIERSIDWAFYKAFRVLQVPLIFLGVLLLFAFMVANFFNLICAFGGTFVSVCSFFFSLTLMMLGISFVACFMMFVFNAMFLFWGDDLVVVNSDEDNADVFELSRRFFFMRKANWILSVLAFAYLAGVLSLILIFEFDKLVLLGVSIPLFFVLKYVKCWLLEMSFSTATQGVVVQEKM